MADKPIIVWENGVPKKIEVGDTAVDGSGNVIGAISSGSVGNMSLSLASDTQTVLNGANDAVDVMDISSLVDGVTASLATGKFTFTADGRFSLSYSGYLTINVSATTVTLGLYKNGSTLITGTEREVTVTTSGDKEQISLTEVPLDFVNTDTVELKIKHSSGVSQVITYTDIGFSIEQIGGGSGSGDMTKAIYDPTSVANDAFDMDNMVESATNKVLTNVERDKLTNIEANADVTDATNVATAGAVMDSNFSAGEGFMRKTGAGAYEAIKSNIGASTDPGTGDDNTSGYAIGSEWINTTLNKVWEAVDVSTGAAVWKDLSLAGGGGSISVEDDAVEIVATASTLNFTGDGVIVTDGGAGQANIAISGGGGSATVSSDFMHLKPSANTGSLIVGNRVPFATIINQDNTNGKIALDGGGGGTFTLQPGKYELIAGIRVGDAGADNIDVQLYDVTNATFIGNNSTGAPYSSTLTTGAQEIAMAMVEPTVATQYEYRVSGVIGTPILLQFGTFIMIKEMDVVGQAVDNPASITPLSAAVGGDITQADLTLSAASDSTDQTITIGPGDTKNIVPERARWVLATIELGITGVGVTNFYTKHSDGTAITLSVQSNNSSTQTYSEMGWVYIGKDHIFKYRTANGANISTLKIWINGWSSDKDDVGTGGMTIQRREPGPTGDIVKADLNAGAFSGSGGSSNFTYDIGSSGVDIVPAEARWILVEIIVTPTGTSQALLRGLMANNQTEVIHAQNKKGENQSDREAGWVYIGGNQLLNYNTFNGLGISSLQINIIGWASAGQQFQTGSALITELLPSPSRDIVKADLTLDNAFNEITIGPGDTKPLVPEEARWVLLCALVQTNSTSTIVGLGAYHAGSDILAGLAQTKQSQTTFTEESFWVYIGNTHTIRYKSIDGANLNDAASWWVAGWATEGT